MRHLPRRALSVVCLALLFSGCPQLLDDDFQTVAVDASTGGGGTDASADGSDGQSGGVGGTAGTSGTGGVDGSDGGNPCASCSSGELCCSDTCVNPLTNAQHCGGCDTGCPGTACVAGQCTSTCVLPYLNCDQNVVNGCEVNAATDPENCGNCGAACSFDSTCVQGKCVCPPGAADCNGDPSDGCEIAIGSDAANCGACGKACGANQLCKAAACECSPGFADCNKDAADGCEVTLASNANHCGSCGSSCGANGVCAAGQCGCATGFLNCDANPGCETSVTSASNCGSCGVICSGSTPVCNGTQCVTGCGAGETTCGTSCVDLSTDPSHCGACGVAVGANQACVGGAPTCNAGFGDCNGQSSDGCETDTTSSAAHCGACGSACKSGAICNQSACQCAANTPNDCGSECRECCFAAQCSDGNPCTTDTCGSSGTCTSAAPCAGGGLCCAGLGCFECCGDTDCTGGKVCSGNQCVTPTCNSPDILCAGVCVNPQTNAKHCGGCGNDCGNGRTCQAGKCTPPWVTTSAPPSGLVARSHTAQVHIPSLGKVFIWGGLDAAAASLGDGALYDPTTDTWTLIPASANSPSPRSLATAVWTGSAVIVWGGGDAIGNEVDTGAAFDPTTGTWTPLGSSGSKPSARKGAFGVWTGTRALFFGGFTGNFVPTDGTVYTYDPQSGSWSKAKTTNEPAKRVHPTVGWSGTSLWVYGGRDGNTLFQDLIRYTPSTDTWTPLEVGPSPRFGAMGTWDGNLFVAWGGRKEGGGPPVTYDDGRRYDPTGSGWSNVTATGVPVARFAQQREHGWSFRVAGGNLLLLGGYTSPNKAATDGALYNSTTNAWAAVPAWPSGQSHVAGAAVWTGTEAVLWGGRDANNAPTSTGERFRP